MGDYIGYSWNPLSILEVAQDVKMQVFHLGAVAILVAILVTLQNTRTPQDQNSYLLVNMRYVGR